MQISITGNIDTGLALQNYVEEKLQKEVKKYFDTAISAHVYFKKENQKQDGNHPIYQVTIRINEGSKQHVEDAATAEDSEIHITFDKALDKIVKQLRRHKDKMQTKNRYNKKNPQDVV